MASFRSIIHLVLAAAATEAAIACGGAVASVGDGTSNASPGTQPSSGTPETNNGRPQQKQDPYNDPEEEGPDANVSDVQTNPPDVVVYQTCKTGSVAGDDKYCCDPDAGPSCSGTFGGDTNSCQLDCKKVCDSVYPGNPYGYDGCWWDTTALVPTINYACGACGVGRIALGAETCVRGDTIADRLAMQAYYEAVSVVAFERLATVLAANGAPRSLVRRARRAAADERRHAARFARLAKEHGATVPEVRVAETPSTLLELALENAAEGQVRETYGALVALHQSRHAETAELRAAFAAIADDEIEHASFSWDLARWFDSKLTPRERAELAATRTAAMSSLVATSLREYDTVDAALGVPAPSRGRMMFDELFARLPQAA